MELKLENNLSHQTAPVEGVAAIVEASIQEPPRASHQNPLLRHQLDGAAIRAVRQSTGILDKATRQRVTHYMLSDKIKALPYHRILDIKMETGTGKTYVYTRTMFELHRRCGINKFIIAVPTLPIKAGTASFLQEPEVTRHFNAVCNYDAEIELCLLEPQKQNKKGRLNMPSAVGHFFYGTHHEKRRIYVLLLNTQLIANGKMLTREDYDQMLDDFYRPVDAIADTKPVLIIDEPHRVERGGKSYAALIENFRPQLVLRYGATFPELTVGKGKNKHAVKDYQELIYDLNAAASFNQGLIKGVAKEHLELPDGKKAEKKVKVLSAVKGDSASLRLTSAEISGRTFAVHVGDSLGVVDSDLDGVVVEAIGKGSLSLSNGQEKLVGEEFFPDQYGASYQEGMIELALMRHFETERENFCREGLPIKTLALFFIESIESFRGPEGKNDGWLRRKFMEILAARLKKELARQNTPEYEAYLKATLDNIEYSCAGYFSQDNNDSDENIANEVKLILHGKKELLNFAHKDGSPNVLRFSNDMHKIECKDDVLTLLCHLGYLSYNNDTKCARIPNYEVRQEFETAIADTSWLEVTSALRQSERLMECLLSGDADEVADCVAEVHEKNTSIPKYNDEKSLACVLSLAFYTSRNHYEMIRELPAGRGFADIVLLPYRHVEVPAVVLELKWNKNADAAISQIKRQKYVESLAHYVGNIILVGINYDKHSKSHSCRIERMTKVTP